ncbi:sterile alpha motif domain-containing protein 3-like, partial [Tachysurus ichikawai]
DHSQSDASRHILKILVVHGADGEAPVDVQYPAFFKAKRPCKDVAVLLKLA